MRMCHCGKCRISCNKHGKVAKCDGCGNKRRLGTLTIGESVKHMCQGCMDSFASRHESHKPLANNPITKESRVALIEYTEEPLQETTSSLPGEPQTKQ